MSVNRYQPHLQVLPEDDAMRQIANGFLLCPDVEHTNLQVMPPAGGWLRVIENVADEYVPTMHRYPARHLVALIDFDGQPGRVAECKDKIPVVYRDRVFVLGIKTEAEDLKKTLGLSFEEIGKRLAADCTDGGGGLWDNELLVANEPEIAAMRDLVFAFVFGR